VPGLSGADAAAIAAANANWDRAADHAARCAASFPSGRYIEICSTVMRRPTWTGTATPVSRPGKQARKIFVFDSIVVVRNPGGTLFANCASAAILDPQRCGVSTDIQNWTPHCLAPNVTG
jgi:hypothetical protein